MEFVDLPEETRQVICHYIRSIIEDGNGAGDELGEPTAIRALRG
jgi:hypothetical protein